MKDSEIASNGRKDGRLPDFIGSSNFQKVMDGRKIPIRGLWQRNKQFYARFTVEDPANGRKKVRRVPLKGRQTVDEARKEMNKLLTRREDKDLPVLKRAPKFADYVETYLAHLDIVVDAKRPATVRKERYTLRHWSAHLGETRLNHINRAMINGFIAKRQGASNSGRTVNHDVIVLRNVLNCDR